MTGTAAVNKDCYVGELAALEEILAALYNERRDDVAAVLLERFGSYGGIFDADENRLEDCGLTERAARFFAYGKRLVRQALLREVRWHAIESARDVVRFAAAHFFGESRPDECLLALDGSGAVRSVARLDGGHALKDAVGKAVILRAERAIWLRYSPTATRAAVDFVRRREIRRARAALEIAGSKLIDYIEYRPPLYFSAAEKNGEIFKSCAEADETPYREIDNQTDDFCREEKRYGSDIVRYGRNARSDGAGRIYESVL